MILENEREFIFTDDNCAQADQLMFKYSGVNISAAKRNMVYSRLSKRLRELSLNDFSHYLKRVKQSIHEQTHFVNAFTTNLTAFFREKHHFTAVEQYLQRHNRSINIWSAGYSSGEEAYSLAMTAIKTRNSFTPKVRVLGSDINSEVLKFAKKGVYNLEDVERLPATIKQSFFSKEKEKIIRQMLTHLRTGGLLMVGHSENYSHLTQELTSVGQTIYQKR